MIRKITRGTSSTNGDKTISCSITNIDKVIVLLNVDGNLSEIEVGNESYYAKAAGSGNVYLKSVSNSNIVVSGYGIGKEYRDLVKSTITFSYQIIEFM